MDGSDRQERPPEPGTGVAPPRLRRFARWMDAAVRVPGTRLRVGLDSVIGLVPGAGDLAGGALSLYLVVEAARLGAPASLLMRMALNVGIDALVGGVPLAGDLFDVVWKANRRNLELLERHLEDPRGTRRASRLAVTGALALAIGTLAAAAAVGIVAARAVVALLG